MVKCDFPYHKGLLLKERICSLCEQILSFKRSSHFEMGHNWKASLLDLVVRKFFSVLATQGKSEYMVKHSLS